MMMLVAGAAFAAEPKVEVSGVQLVWKDDAEAFGGFDLFGAQRPVSLALVADGGGEKVIAFDSDGSSLDSFGDDKGGKFEAKIGPFDKIAEDGSGVRFELWSEDAPTQGATALIARGTVKIRTGGATATRKSEIVALTKGGEVELGEGLAFEISKVGKPDWGDDPMQVELKINRDIPEVAAVRFYDKNGQEIESSESGSGRMGFMKKVTVTKGYTLKREVKEVRLEMDVWTDMEEHEVPFEVKVGIGGKME